MNKVAINCCVITLLAISSVACVGNPALERDFGKSVAQLQDSQIFDRSTIDNPNMVPPTGQDGVTAVGKLESAYREAQSARSAKQTFKTSVFKD